MLWDWSIAVSITLSLILGSVIASFFFKSIFSFKSEQNVSTMERELKDVRRSVFFHAGLTYLFQILNSTVTILSKVFEAPAILIYLLSVIWSNRQLVFFLSFSASVAYAIFNNGDSLLSSLDNSYRCGILPFVNNLVFSVLHVINYIFATIAPLWNTYFFLGRQLVIGTRLILTNCASSTLSIASFLGGFATFIKTNFKVIIDYTGFTALSENNNVIVNEMNIQLIFQSLRSWFDWIPSVLICSCQGVGPWIKASMYGIFDLDHLDYIAHHFINAGISFMQVFLKVLPPFLTYPDFSKVAYHIASIVIESGVLFDAWLAKFVETFIIQLGANLIIDLPKNFIGTTSAHFFASGIHGFETFSNSTMHTVVPFDRPTDVNFMQEVYSLDKSFTHLGMFSANLKLVFSWSLQTLVYVLMMKNWETKCVNFDGCVQYASSGQCAVACEGQTIHFFANDVVCPVIIDMEDKYIAKKSEFDKVERQLGMPYVNGFKSAKTEPLLENKILEVQVTQLTNKFLVQTTVGEEIIDKQLLDQEPNWDHYVRDVYLRRYHSIFDTVACGFESLIKVFFNTFHVIYDLSNTVLWDYFFGNAFEESTLTFTELRRIIVKHVGPPFGRDYDPPSYNAINRTWDKELRSYNGYKNYLEKNSITRYNNINFHEHVLYEMDKSASYLLAHIFEENTFGKMFYNSFRLFIELIRSMLESVIDNQLDQKVGCNRIYNGTIGSCTTNYDVNNKYTLCAASNTEGCVCNPMLPLSVNSSCQCIWKILSGEEYFTTEAVANYCRLNLFEFLFVFPRRVVEGARNIVQSLQAGNTMFPAVPNKCLIEAPDGFKRQLYAQTQVFSRKYVTMYPELQCPTYFSKDFACNFGDILVKLTDIVLVYFKDILRNSFIIVGNIARRNVYGTIELDFSDEVCNIQKTLSSVAPILVSLTNGFKAPSKHNTKIYFAIIDILSVMLQTVDILVISFRDELLDINVSGEFNLLDLFEDIVINTLDVIFTWLLQLLKAIVNYDELPSAMQQALVGTMDDVHNVITSIVRVFFWIVDFLVSNIIKILNTPGSGAYQRADARVQRRIKQLEKVINDVVEIIMETFLNDIKKALETLKQTVCGALCSIEKSIPGVAEGDLGSTSGFCQDYDTNSCQGVGEALEDVGNDIADTGSSIINDVGSFLGFRRRRLLESDDIVKRITNKPIWNGMSSCDLIMKSLRNETVESLTRMEKVFFQDCLSRRVEGESISHFLHLPYASDIFYNWKKPFQIVYHTSRIGLIYIPWSFGNTSKKELRHHLGLAGYDANVVLRFLNKWTKHAKKTRFSEKFKKYHSQKNTVTKNFIGTLHHLLFKNNWKEHQELLQNGISSIMKNQSAVQLGFPKDFRFLSKRVTAILDKNIVLKDATFGYYTNLECPADSLLCLNCAIVDNYLYAAVKQVEHSIEFYDGPYIHIIQQTFSNHWDNVSDYSRKYDKAYKESIDNDFGSIIASLSATPTFSFSEWINGVFRMERSVFELSEGVANFINGNYTGDLSSDAVQIFPNDLYYYVASVFDTKCDDPKVIYSSYDDRVGNGLFNVFMVYVVWELFQILIMRFNALASILVYLSLSQITTIIYYYTVYGFNPVCFGMVPTFVIHDFLTWLDREVFLDCFCAYIPSLSTQACAQQTCDTCDVISEYYSCKDVASGFDQLGPFWHFVFLFRWIVPEWFATLGNSNAWPVSYIFQMEGMEKLLQDVNRKLDVTSKEISCFYLNLLTPVSVIVGSYILLLMTLPLIRIIVNITKEMFMIIINMFIALVYFARTLDD
ncbi:MAG: hypothetical protein CMO44_02865 [Verrucomicrobiales bacterium]|nr:hypothetical protein [Verrucomicrobiales bacterium]